MKHKYNILFIIYRIYKLIIKIVPVSSLIGFFNTLIQGILPAITTLILSKFIENVYEYHKGVENINDIIRFGELYIFILVISNVVQFISNITVNYSIYEKSKNYFLLKLSEKSAKLPLITYEVPENLDMINRAKDAINQEILSKIYISVSVIFINLISLSSVILVLSSYSIWFVPISLFSVIPFFISRLIRGKEFYTIKYYQSKDSRKLNYYWSLFSNKNSAKEMRIFNFFDYISEKLIATRDRINHDNLNYDIKENKSILFCDFIKVLGYRRLSS